MKKGIYLFLIVICAFVVRAIGINYGLPFLYHDDEPIIVNYALAYGTGDFNPHVFNIPPLLTYVLFFIYGIFFVIGKVFGFFHNLKDFAYLYLNNPAPFYIIGRVIYGLLCGTASVAVLYFLGKKYFNRTVGILASLFLALNFLHVRDSHYVYFDIPLVFCSLLFFLKCHDFFTPARKADYLQLGALFGLCLSVKYQGVYLIIPSIMIILYNLHLSKVLSLREKIQYLILFAGASFALMFVSNPFLFLNISGLIHKAQKFPFMPVPPFFHIRVSLFNGCGALMVLFGLAGMVYSLIRRGKSALMALYVTFYYLFIIKITQPGERLVLPIMPLILLFAAYAVIRMGALIKNASFSNIVILILSLLLVYPSIIRVYYSDLLFLREDTRTEAYRWIKDNVKPKSRIMLDATSSGFPRLEKDKEQIRDLKKYFGTASFKKPANADQIKLDFMLENPSYPEKTYYLFYLREITKRGFLSIYPCINIRYQELEDNNADYVVLANILTDKKYSDFVKELESHAVVIKTFSPYKDGISRIGSVEMSTVPAAAFMNRELLDRKSYGPYIRIYEIRK